ncbi:hypothetical protein PPTG_06272 [Phytophthora nicotianae INRA-310]|uniref:Uncharacterized protein n=3 Tax=Phytophthora nicotianae TaxID=4792 RepID=W2QSU9_PHYN3|nr:hypothetical protein PPTG_06272 [Phytophthora nicotianae INRA-310]ETI31498.1 hypothetical protein F443_21543 [Phytophthora nicotianae P1569]ETN16041.1 hypothetical protein PPTG_06272 [Phytophthora nicotianae INRA-310]ETO60202.1 hypothetical protein F444_21558 [Phytophthora nicotianae P1976]
MVNKANELDEESALVGDEPFGFPDNDERIQDEDNIHLIIHGPNRFILRFPSMACTTAARLIRHPKCPRRHHEPVYLVC